MPLVVHDSSLTPSQLACFRQKVTAALSCICPGDVFITDPDGRVSECESAGCDLYCDHRAGCHLLECVLGSGPESSPFPDVTIERGASAYFPSDSANVAQQNTLRWGGSSTTLSELVHELIHVCHDYQGVHQGADKFSDPMTGMTERKEELCATCSENQVRAELGMDARVDYAGGGIKLDCASLEQYGSAATPCSRLDTSDQRGCLCPAEIHTEVATLAKELPRKVKRKVQGILGPPLDKISLLWDGIIARLGGSPREGPDEFAPFLDTGTDLDWMVGSANQLRRRQRSELLPLSRVEDLVDGSTHAMVLETVSPSGYYGIMLLAAGVGEARLLTNLEYVPDASGFVGPSTKVVSVPLPGFRSELVSRLEDPESIGFRIGLGGDTKVNDGLTQFLTVRVGERIDRTALVGYTHAGFDSRGRRDWVLQDDLDRWDAVNVGIELWRAAMETLR